MKREFLAHRVDSNQPEIVDAFRKLGWAVSPTHMVGNGYPDITISKYGWLTMVVEIKNSLKAPSQRELKTAQKTFLFFTWQGLRAVVKCKADVIAIDQQAKALAA